MAASSFSLKREREHAGFRSNAALAVEVLARWSKLEPKAARPEPRSLAAKLSNLERNPVWWRNHPRAAEALAAALGLRRDDLPLAASASAPRQHVFAELRDLPPLDLASQEPCRVTEPPWWSPDLLTRRTWINARRGSGKSLAASVLRARGARVIDAPRLIDAVGHLSADEAVVIHVDGPDEATDGAATDELRVERILVLANFAPPVGPRRLAHALEVLKENARERMSIDQLRALVAKLDWTTIEWTPIPEWRDRFLRWIFDRLETDDRHLAAIRTWLRSHDENGRLFATPGDVLALVGRAWEAPITRLNPQGLIDWWVERRIAAAPPDGASRKSWLGAHGERAIRAIADAAFEDPTVVFPVRAEAAWWSERVPANVAPAAPLTALDARVQELARESRKGEREALARAWRRDAIRVSTLEAIAHLRAAEFFEPSGGRAIELAPPWVVEWWAEARAKNLMLHSEASTWGRLAAEPSRRRIIERTLDALDEGPLVELIERALRTAESVGPTLGIAGAIEALFGAVGRRLLKYGARRTAWPLAPMHALFARQREHLMPRFNDHFPQPLTRDSGERPEDAPWIAECWAWSFGFRKPPGGLCDDLAWLFPGWSQVSLAGLPQWLHSIHADGSPSFAFASRLAKSALDKVPDTDLPPRVPEVLLLDAVLMAGRRNWPLTSGHVGMIVGRPALASAFVDRLQQVTSEDRRSVVTELWRVLVATQHWSMSRLRRERPALLDLLVDALDVDEVATAAERGALPFLALLERPFWPASWWNAAALVLIPKHEREISALHDVYLDIDAAEVVEVLANRYDHDGRWKDSLWQIAPERALALAVAGYPDAAETSAWFFTAPASTWAPLIRAIENSRPNATPSWTRRWLVRALRDAGAGADRVFALLHATTG